MTLRPAISRIEYVPMVDNATDKGFLYFIYDSEPEMQEALKFLDDRFRDYDELPLKLSFSKGGASAMLWDGQRGIMTNQAGCDLLNMKAMVDEMGMTPNFLSLGYLEANAFVKVNATEFKPMSLELDAFSR